MYIIDTHCDALYKMQREKVLSQYEDVKKSLSFKSSEILDTNLIRLKSGNIRVQFFAIFLEPDIPCELKWNYALEQVDIFYEEILAKHTEMKHIKSWYELDYLRD